jgi:hypothetical protein
MTSVLTLLPTLLSSLLAQAPQQPPATVLEILSLRQPGPAPGELSPPAWSTMLSRPESTVDLLAVCADDPHGFDPDWIVEILRRTHGAAIEEERLRLELAAEALYVLGEAATVAAVKAQCRDLVRALTRELAVEVAVWRGGDVATGDPILSRADYERLAASHERLWQCAAPTISARPVRLENASHSDYIADMEVEIAQKASAADPVVDTFFTGADFLVVPHALVGSDGFVVHLQFTWAELDGPVGKIATGIPDSSPFDSPRVRSACAACSGLIEDGGALCVTMRGDRELGADCLVTVRVRATERSSATELGIFPISALTSRALLARIVPPGSSGEAGNQRGPETAVADADSSPARLDEDAIVDLVRSVLTGEQQEQAEFDWQGGVLRVAGPDDTVERAATTLRGRERQLLRNVRVLHRTCPATPDAAGGAFSEMLLPTLYGRQLSAARRSERNTIRDLDVEVAQGERISDPKVVTLQSGTWLSAQVIALEEQAALQLQSRTADHAVGEPRAMVPDGALQLSSVASQRIDWNGSATAGATIRHGDGPVIVRGEQPQRTAVETVLRW